MFNAGSLARPIRAALDSFAESFGEVAPEVSARHARLAIAVRVLTVLLTVSVVKSAASRR